MILSYELIRNIAEYLQSIVLRLQRVLEFLVLFEQSFNVVE